MKSPEVSDTKIPWRANLKVTVTLNIIAFVSVNIQSTGKSGLVGKSASLHRVWLNQLMENPPSCSEEQLVMAAVEKITTDLFPLGKIKCFRLFWHF